MNDWEFPKDHLCYNGRIKKESSHLLCQIQRILNAPRYRLNTRGYLSDGQYLLTMALSYSESQLPLSITGSYKPPYRADFYLGRVFSPT